MKLSKEHRIHIAHTFETLVKLETATMQMCGIGYVDIKLILSVILEGSDDWLFAFNEPCGEDECSANNDHFAIKSRDPRCPVHFEFRAPKFENVDLLSEAIIGEKKGRTVH